MCLKTFYSDHRAKAKSKKQKMGSYSKTPEIPESADQVLVTPKANIEEPEDHHDGQDDPPPQTEVRASKSNDADANLGDNLNPLSPIPASSLAKATEEIPHEKDNDEIAIIGVSQRTPETSNLLTK
jgi:hypothetical protein